MSDLETAIRNSLKAGRLNHISLAVKWDGTWEAAYRGTSTEDHRIATHSDPTSALLMALTGRKIDEPKKSTQRARKPAPAPVVADDDEDLL